MESNNDPQPSPPSISTSPILYVIIEVIPKSSNTYANIVWIHPNKKVETKLGWDGSVISLSMKENFRFTVDAGFIDDEDFVVGVEV